MHDFGDDVIEDDVIEEKEDLPPPPPIFTEADLNAAKKKAYDEGHAAGKKEVEESRAHALANTMGMLGSDLGQIFSAEREREAVYEREVIALCRAIFEHAYPSFSDKLGFDALTLQIETIIQQQQNQHSIEIRVAEPFAKGVEAFIEKLKAQNDDLNITIVGDSDIKEGCFEMRWKDGGALYDAPKVAQSILGNLEEMLAGEAATSHDKDEKESQEIGDLSADTVTDTANNPDPNPIAEDSHE